MYQKLLFRRQFLLTQAPITLLPDWKSHQIDRYYLYTHPDLDVNAVAGPKRSTVLIGSIFDPMEPEKQNAGILKEVYTSATSIETLFLHIKRYAGVYVLFYKDDKHIIVLHDALGLREVYYCTKNNQIVCGSQPNLIARFANPEIGPSSDPELLDFYHNHLKNCSWIGDETYYSGIKHLLPNHYLDIANRAPHRYWPDQPLKQLTLDEAVAKSCSFLQGTIRAMVHRHPIMMAVTAGTDSRTLLAASRSVNDRIYYFINDEGLGDSHPDISVPKKMFDGIGLPFHVHDVPNDVDDEFRKIFLNNTFFASERVLSTIYNVYFKNHSEKVNLLGTGEIGRTRFGEEPKNLNSYLMAYKMGYKNCPYAIRQGEQILAELLPVGRKFGINVLSLLHWEQNKGNRWVVGNSESDIAIEEIDPFDSHLLYEFFYSVDRSYVKNRNNILFRELIRTMWPELLKWPINPPFTMRDKAKCLLAEVGLFDLLKELKYQVNYFRYRKKLLLSVKSSPKTIVPGTYNR